MRSYTFTLSEADLVFSGVWAIGGTNFDCTAVWTETMAAHGGFIGFPHVAISSDFDARLCVKNHADNGSAGHAFGNALIPDWDGPGSSCPVLASPSVEGLDYSVSSGHGTASATWASDDGGVGLPGTYGYGTHKARTETALITTTSDSTWQSVALSWTSPLGPNGAGRDVLFPDRYTVLPGPQWTVSDVQIAVRSSVTATCPAAYSYTSDFSNLWWNLDSDILGIGGTSDFVPVEPIDELTSGGTTYRRYPNVRYGPEVPLPPAGTGSLGAAISLVYRFTLNRNILTVCPPLHQRQRTGGMEGHAMHHSAGISTRNLGKFSRGTL